MSCGPSRCDALAQSLPQRPRSRARRAASHWPVEQQNSRVGLSIRTVIGRTVMPTLRDSMLIARERANQEERENRLIHWTKESETGAILAERDGLLHL